MVPPVSEILILDLTLSLFCCPLFQFLAFRTKTEDLTLANVFFNLSFFLTPPSSQVPMIQVNSRFIV